MSHLADVVVIRVEATLAVVFEMLVVLVFEMECTVVVVAVVVVWVAQQLSVAGLVVIAAKVVAVVGLVGGAMAAQEESSAVGAERYSLEQAGAARLAFCNSDPPAVAVHKLVAEVVAVEGLVVSVDCQMVAGNLAEHFAGWVTLLAGDGTSVVGSVVVGTAVDILALVDWVVEIGDLAACLGVVVVTLVEPHAC